MRNKSGEHQRQGGGGDRGGGKSMMSCRGICPGCVLSAPAVLTQK